jgi:hypothetical protein
MAEFMNQVGNIILDIGDFASAGQNLGNKAYNYRQVVAFSSTLPTIVSNGRLATLI